MKFEWDEKKNEANIEKHGFDFMDGEELFEGSFPFLVAADVEASEEEERWKGVGVIEGRVAVAVFVEREAGVIRFISLRKANRQERMAYEEAIKNELGAH